MWFRKHRVYLDGAAAQPILPEVQQAVAAELARPGNASALHAEGVGKALAVAKARTAVARLMGVRVTGLVFTSGTSESITTVLSAFARGGAVVLSSADHPATKAAAKQYAKRVIEVPTDEAGVMEDEAFRAAVKEEDVVLVSLLHTNNVTGAVEDVRARKKVVPKHVFVHVDAAQSLLWSDVAWDDLGVSFVSAGAAKIGGPSGVGALFIDPKLEGRPLIPGGGQERGWRGGTENVPAIVGFGVAAEKTREERKRLVRTMTKQRRKLSRALSRHKLVEVAAKVQAPHILALRLPHHIDAEEFVIRLDAAGVAVSSGSACTNIAGKQFSGQPLLRLSLTRAITQRDLHRCIATIKQVMHTLSV